MLAFFPSPSRFPRPGVRRGGEKLPEPVRFAARHEIPKYPACTALHRLRARRQESCLDALVPDAPTPRTAADDHLWDAEKRQRWPR